MRFISLLNQNIPQAAPESDRGGVGRQAVAEIVTFRLIDGSSPKDFVAAASAITPFLRATKAVLSRTLSQGDDGVWVDHITWTSLKEAEDVAQRLMARPEAAPMMNMIAPDSVAMRHAPIQFSMPQG